MSEPVKFYRIMMGKKSVYAELGRQQGFIGGDWNVHVDFSGKFPEHWRDFGPEFLPHYHAANPGKSKVAAGLARGMLYTICKAISVGDIILTPKGDGSYYLGEVAGDYHYVEGEPLPHRRKVTWYTKTIHKDDMSEGLRNSSGSIGTVSEISKHAQELRGFIEGDVPSTLVSTDELVEDPNVFALEQHLEDFLVANWSQTEFGRNYDIYEDDDELVGKQYPTDTGRIDILAISKDKNELLVVELKKGRASDAVVGQVQRYMGDVLEQYADEGQTVRGAIVALEDDLRIRRALRVTQNIDFYRYQVSFKLFKSDA